MKKIVLYLCAGILAFGLTACGKGGEEPGSQEEGSSMGSSQEESGDGSSGTDGSASQEESTGLPSEGEGMDEPGAGAEGLSDEMNGLRQAVVDALGADNYWPDMPMDAQMFGTFFGITEDMYEDFMAESPMISTNVDTLVIVKAAEGKADAVEEALNAYREAKVNDTMQYPQNLGKIQASQVERIDNYVIFVQLGGFAIEAENEEDVIAQCQEANQLAIDTIRGKL